MAVSYNEKKEHFVSKNFREQKCKVIESYESVQSQKQIEEVKFYLKSLPHISLIFVLKIIANMDQSIDHLPIWAQERIRKLEDR